MSILFNLSSLALRHLVEGSIVASGAEAVVGFLTERFTDHSQRLPQALKTANERAWKALETALAGDSLWERCKSLVTRSEDKAFAQQVRAYLDSFPLPELAGKKQFRQKCQDDLQAARKAGLLTGGNLDTRQLAKAAGDFARFTDSKVQLRAEWGVVHRIATELSQAGYKDLAWLLSQRPQNGLPLLLVGVRYFFQRAVEDDPKLARGLTFAHQEAQAAAQEQGFGQLAELLKGQSARLEELLADIYAVAVETRSGVQRIEKDVAGLHQKMDELTARLGLRDRQVRSTDTTSIRNEEERELVRQLLRQYRGLPEPDRKRRPELLNAVARLENAAGEHEQAANDYREVATLATNDKQMQAEARYNAYRAGLERANLTKRKEDWQAALVELVEASNLDRRYLPFDARKYQPRSILGAGGFGVTFLCKRRGPEDLVAVKSLLQENLGRDTSKVLQEGRLLVELEHPAIIRMLDCDYTNPKAQTGPFIVMAYFEGPTLEEYVRSRKRISVKEALSLFRQVADGMRAAHAKGLLHRDIKPANLLVRWEQETWQVKIIDFGLALRHEFTQPRVNEDTSRQGKTLAVTELGAG